MAEQLTPEKMDAYAGNAKDELFRMAESPLAEDEPTLSQVAKWWASWYPKCGHKRLGRIILKFVPEEEQEVPDVCISKI